MPKPTDPRLNRVQTLSPAEKRARESEHSIPTTGAAPGPPLPVNEEGRRPLAALSARTNSVNVGLIAGQSQAESGEPPGPDAGQTPPSNARNDGRAMLPPHPATPLTPRAGDAPKPHFSLQIRPTNGPQIQSLPSTREPPQPPPQASGIDDGLMPVSPLADTQEHDDGGDEPGDAHASQAALHHPHSSPVTMASPTTSTVSRCCSMGSSMFSPAGGDGAASSRLYEAKKKKEHYKQLFLSCMERKEHHKSEAERLRGENEMRQDAIDEMRGRIAELERRPTREQHDELATRIRELERRPTSEEHAQLLARVAELEARPSREQYDEVVGENRQLEEVAGNLRTRLRKDKEEIRKLKAENERLKAAPSGATTPAAVIAPSSSSTTAEASSPPPQAEINRLQAELEKMKAAVQRDNALRAQVLELKHKASQSERLRRELGEAKSDVTASTMALERERARNVKLAEKAKAAAVKAQDDHTLLKGEFAALRTSELALRRQVDGATAVAAKLEAELKAARESADRFKAELDRVSGSAAERRDDFAKLRASEQASKKRAEDASARSAKLEAELKGARDTAAQLKSELDGLRGSATVAEASKDELAKLRTTEQSLRKKAEDATAVAAKLQAELQALTASNGRLAQAEADLKHQVSELDTKAATREKELAEKQAQLDEAKSQKENMMERLNDVQGGVFDLNDQLRKLKEEKSRLEECLERARASSEAGRKEREFINNYFNEAMLTAQVEIERLGRERPPAPPAPAVAPTAAPVACPPATSNTPLTPAPKKRGRKSHFEKAQEEERRVHLMGFASLKLPGEWVRAAFEGKTLSAHLRASRGVATQAGAAEGTAEAGPSQQPHIGPSPTAPQPAERVEPDQATGQVPAPLPVRPAPPPPLSCEPALRIPISGGKRPQSVARKSLNRDQAPSRPPPALPLAAESPAQRAEEGEAPPVLSPIGGAEEEPTPPPPPTDDAAGSGRKRATDSGTEQVPDKRRREMEEGNDGGREEGPVQAAEQSSVDSSDGTPALRCVEEAADESRRAPRQVATEAGNGQEGAVEPAGAEAGLQQPLRGGGGAELEQPVADHQPSPSTPVERLQKKPQELFLRLSQRPGTSRGDPSPQMDFADYEGDEEESTRQQVQFFSDFYHVKRQLSKAAAIEAYLNELNIVDEQGRLAFTEMLVSTADELEESFRDGPEQAADGNEEQLVVSSEIGVVRAAADEDSHSRSDHPQQPHSSPARCPQKKPKEESGGEVPSVSPRQRHRSGGSLFQLSDRPSSSHELLVPSPTDADYATSDDDSVAREEQIGNFTKFYRDNRHLSYIEAMDTFISRMGLGLSEGEREELMATLVSKADDLEKTFREQQEEYDAPSAMDDGEV